MMNTRTDPLHTLCSRRGIFALVSFDYPSNFRGAFSFTQYLEVSVMIISLAASLRYIVGIAHARETLHCFTEQNYNSNNEDFISHSFVIVFFTVFLYMYVFHYDKQQFPGNSRFFLTRKYANKITESPRSIKFPLSKTVRKACILLIFCLQ